jgi:hypothetical protein
VSGPIFMFCALGLVLGGIDGVESHFHVLCSRICLGLYTEGVGCRFHVLLSRNYFVRCRGLRAPFSCFALSKSFGDVPRASGPVFMFCAAEHVFGVPRALGPVFMFCATGLVLGGTAGVRYSF